MKTIEDPDIVALFKNRLERELIETDRLIDESREYRAPVELDQQSVGRLSRMDAMQQQAMAQDINRRRQRRKIAIDRALNRIRDGEFGYCAGCGEPIAVRRLEIDPTFEACVRCAP
ncbi:MAG: TraR/DksA family transcriptional regulator [Rhizobium rhizophilum]|uniref:TraR/DksA family transcriptional regulator n=1 Tax=Rhizobium rhizophilum TaxID=1850373 RepID=UPI00391C820A